MLQDVWRFPSSHSSTRFIIFTPSNKVVTRETARSRLNESSRLQLNTIVFYLLLRISKVRSRE